MASNNTKVIALGTLIFVVWVAAAVVVRWMMPWMPANIFGFVAALVLGALTLALGVAIVVAPFALADLIVEEWFDGE